MNLLALALVMGMVWKMEKKVVEAIFQENLEKSSATVDTVCFSKRLTDKSFLLYSQIGQAKKSSDSNILHASGV